MDRVDLGEKKVGQGRFSLCQLVSWYSLDWAMMWCMGLWAKLQFIVNLFQPKFMAMMELNQLGSIQCLRETHSHLVYVADKRACHFCHLLSAFKTGS